MWRGHRLGWMALGVSLVLHVGLLGGLDGVLPAWKVPPESSPFETQLVFSPIVAVESDSPPIQAPPAAKRTALSPALVHSLTTPHPATPGVPVMSTVETGEPELAAPVALVDPERVETPAQEGVALPSLNVLPPRLSLHFQVHYGLASGEQTLVWVSEVGRYTLTSVAGATGLAGVFYRGQFVQTSSGRITPRGLQPETFWDQRGDKRSSARFDAVLGQLTFLPVKGAPRHFDYQGEVQDALSLFFQLALTAPPTSQQISYRVFNGKKLREYTYEVRGETMLETTLGLLRTLHLVRVADHDGRFEAWLAADRHYLPVRVLRSDDKGNEVELNLQSITP